MGTTSFRCLSATCQTISPCSIDGPDSCPASPCPRATWCSSRPRRSGAVAPAEGAPTGRRQLAEDEVVRVLDHCADGLVGSEPSIPEPPWWRSYVDDVGPA